MVTLVSVNTPDGPALLWSVDANVGLNSANKQADVDLVQLGYAYRLSNAKAPKSAGEIAAYKKVKVGAPCTGRSDDPLVQAIVAHEVARGGTQDGHVSPFTKDQPAYFSADGKHTKLCVGLMFSVMDGLAMYPRLDQSTNPPCPPTLKAAVLKMCRFS